MPIYEYECSDCHSHFDRRQSFDEEPVAMCPECNGKSRRVIHAVSVVYKGSGWYVTDYARKSIVGANGSKPSESPADTKGAEKPAETAKQAVASGGKTDAPTSEAKASPRAASKASSSKSKGT